MYVCLYVCVCVCTMFQSLNNHRPGSTYVFVCMFVCTHVCMYACIMSSLLCQPLNYHGRNEHVYMHTCHVCMHVCISSHLLGSIYLAQNSTGVIESTTSKDNSSASLHSSFSCSLACAAALLESIQVKRSKH
jgi:hypothetical protein